MLRPTFRPSMEPSTTPVRSHKAFPRPTNCTHQAEVVSQGGTLRQPCVLGAIQQAAPGIRLCRLHGAEYREAVTAAHAALPAVPTEADLGPLKAVWERFSGRKSTGDRLVQLLEHLFDQVGQHGRPHGLAMSPEREEEAETYSPYARKTALDSREEAIRREMKRRKHMARTGSPDMVDRQVAPEAQEPLRMKDPADPTSKGIDPARADDIVGFAVDWKGGSQG